MWLYEQKTGRILHDGAYIATGYAGRGAALNDPGQQDVHGLEAKPDAGPLPRGGYTIGAPIDSHGGYALPLSPWPDNDMCGRGSFYIHGDMKSGPPHQASLGCIILPRVVRMQIWESADHSLTVIRGDES